VHASSVGVYSPGPKDRLVDESWPRQGIPTSFYSVHKAECERRLDVLERREPGMRVVRVRPALTFKREAASGMQRLWTGPLLPASLVRPSRLPAVPDIPGLRFQGVHAEDVAEGYRLLAVGDAAGAVNLAADPVLDPEVLAEGLGARRVPMPARLARGLVDLSWRLRLQPTPPGWLDMGLSAPLMDTSRAREELGWRPRRTSIEALRELLEGIADGAGTDTPPLAPRA
jgi:nucleoside-diphosphate-sugar epimerase